MNALASAIVFSFSGRSQTKIVPIKGEGIYLAYFDGVTLGNMYTVTVQPFNGLSGGRMLTRDKSMQPLLSANMEYICMILMFVYSPTTPTM